MITLLRRFLLFLLIRQLIKTGSLTKKQYKIMQEQMLRLNNKIRRKR